MSYAYQTPVVEFVPTTRTLFIYSRDGKAEGERYSPMPKNWEVEDLSGLEWMSIFWTKDPQWWAPT